MAELIIETRGLRKDYRSRGGRRVAGVDGLDLEVPRGRIHGLLGPNGSGKTTTIRMLLGLARPGGGELKIFGEPVPERLPAVIGRIGAVVESPRFTPTFTGRRNLMLLAGAAGIGRAEVKRVLDRVGLTDRARDRVASYSFGMRQRLAIAAALLKSPELLILDEPTLGLDPAGIRDVRELIRDLAGDGVTIVMSSNNLAEVQQVCASVTIVGSGRTIATGEVADLVGEDRSQTRVRVPDPSAARTVLEEAGFVVHGEGADLVVEGHGHPEQITEVLAGHRIWVSELSEIRPDLESVFLALTREHEIGATR